MGRKIGLIGSGEAKIGQAMVIVINAPWSGTGYILLWNGMRNAIGL